MKQFWMVWTPEGHSPTFKHKCFSDATVEAERLARMNQGKPFYVLEAIVARCYDAMQRIDLRRDDDTPDPELPF